MEDKNKVINTYQELLEYVEKTHKKDIHIYQRCKIESFEPVFVRVNWDCEEEDFISYLEYVGEHKEGER
jgi:hypothetical protein